MTITNQTYVQNVTSFRAIQPEIIQNLGKYPRIFRENLGKSYKVLENSEILDLVLNQDDEVVLKAKKDLHDIILTSRAVPKGTELKEETVEKIDDSILRCRCYSSDSSAPVDFGLDFGSSENAKSAFTAYGKKTCVKSFLPMFGALIDAAYRLNKPIREMKQIMRESFEL